jgi:hypothetical protein
VIPVPNLLSVVRWMVVISSVPSIPSRLSLLYRPFYTPLLYPSLLYHRHAEFAQLSAEEEQMNLLGRADIGTRCGWEAVLRECGVKIVGNSVVSMAPDLSSEEEKTQMQ